MQMFLETLLSAAHCEPPHPPDIQTVRLYYYMHTFPVHAVLSLEPDTEFVSRLITCIIQAYQEVVEH